MCSYIYAPFLPNFSLGVLNPHVLVCEFLLYSNNQFINVFCACSSYLLLTQTNFRWCCVHFYTNLTIFSKQLYMLKKQLFPSVSISAVEISTPSELFSEERWLYFNLFSLFLPSTQTEFEVAQWVSNTDISFLLIFDGFFCKRDGKSYYPWKYQKYRWDRRTVRVFEKQMVVAFK